MNLRNNVICIFWIVFAIALAVVGVSEFRPDPMPRTGTIIDKRYEVVRGSKEHSEEDPFFIIDFGAPQGVLKIQPTLADYYRLNVGNRVTYDLQPIVGGFSAKDFGLAISVVLGIVIFIVAIIWRSNQ